MSATVPPVHTDAVRRPRRSLRFVRDEELVRLVRAGDECAFEAIYDRHHRGILSFCRHMLGSREEAEDAVQQTFIGAFRDLAGSDKPIQLKAWLYTIARNRCLSILRARREERALDDVPEPSVEGLASQVQHRQDLRDLLADLERLPEDQRAALVLAELGALSHEEIAVTLDVRKDKVKALVFQARESLASSRSARNADCREIQQQLAVLRGGALRRTELRRHVDVCPACSAFKAEVHRQRAAMAIVLPVVPTVALKETALTAGLTAAKAAAGGGAAGGGLAGGGVAGGGVAGSVASSGGGTAGGGLLAAAGAKGIAAKVLTIAVVAGGATGGGLLAVDGLGTAPADDSGVPLAVAPDERRSVRMVAALRERAARSAEQRDADRAGGRAPAGGASGEDADRGGAGGRGATGADRRPASGGAGVRDDDDARPADRGEASQDGRSPAGGGGTSGAGGAPAGGSTVGAPASAPSQGGRDDDGDRDDGERDDDDDDDDGATKAKKTKKAKKPRGPRFPTPRRGSVGNSPVEPPGQQKPNGDRPRPKVVPPPPDDDDDEDDRDRDRDRDDAKGPKDKARAALDDVLSAPRLDS